MDDAKVRSVPRFARILQIIGVISILVGTAFLVKLGIDYFGALFSEDTIWLWGIVHFITIVGSGFMILNGLFFIVLAWMLHWLLDVEQRIKIVIMDW